MPGGVVFLVCIPTSNYEHELIFGVPLKPFRKNEKSEKPVDVPKVNVHLRETRTKAQLLTLDNDDQMDDVDIANDSGTRRFLRARGTDTSGLRRRSPVFVSMETVTMKNI